MSIKAPTSLGHTLLPLVDAAHRRPVHIHHDQGHIPHDTRLELDHRIYRACHQLARATQVFCIEYIPVLPSLLEARVQICTDDTLIQFGASDILHTVQRILMGIVLDEAETAGGLVESVETHHQPLDLAAPGRR